MNFNKLLESNNENQNENNLIKNLELSNNLFKVDAYNKNNRFNNKTIMVTRPSLVMYNVTVNNNTPIDLVALAQRIQPPFKKFIFQNNGISIQVTKVTGLTGRFQAAFTITNTYNRTGILNPENIFALDFYMKIKMGGEYVNATFTLFKNGKIKM